MKSGLKNGITRATNLCPRRFRRQISQRNVKPLKFVQSTSFKRPGGDTMEALIFLTTPQAFKPTNQISPLTLHTQLYNPATVRAKKI